jgi:hypothetical protein
MRGDWGHILDFGSSALTDDQSWLKSDSWRELGLSRYLHLNPVRIHRMELDKKQQQARRRGLAERTSTAFENVMAISLAIRRFRSRSSREKSLSKGVAQAVKKLEMCSRNV